MKIAYLSYSAIPSREANGVHVMKMCRAFAKHGHQVTLFARHGQEAADDVYRYYGVERIFEIVWLRQLPIGEVGKARKGRLLLYAQRMHSGLGAVAIGRRYGRTHAAVRMAVRVLEAEAARDRLLASRLSQLGKSLE